MSEIKVQRWRNSYANGYKYDKDPNGDFCMWEDVQLLEEQRNMALKRAASMAEGCLRRDREITRLRSENEYLTKELEGLKCVKSKL